MLSDRQGNVSSAAAKLFSTLIYDRANALQQEVFIFYYNTFSSIDPMNLRLEY